VAIKRCEVFAQIVKIEKPINAAQQVIRGNVGFEFEGIKQLVLCAFLLTQHLDLPSSLAYASDQSQQSKFK